MNFKKYVSNSFEETLSVQDKINWSVESLRCIDFTVRCKQIVKEIDNKIYYCRVH